MSSFPLHCVALAALALVLGSPTPSEAWQTHLVGTGNSAFALAVAFGPDGSVVAGGIDDLSGDHGYATVAKLASDGTLVWRRTVDPWGSRSRSVAVDAAGDVLVGGLAGGQDESDLGHFTAVKLAGGTGMELWRHEPVDSVAGGMLVDRTGDVLASITVVVNPGTDDQDYRTLCRKLSGVDGSVLWQVDQCTDAGAVDANGDVYVGGYQFFGKLSGEDGHELWRATPIPLGGAAHIAIDDSGSVVVAQRAEVAKVTGDDGTLVWRRTVIGFDDQFEGIRALTTDVRGNVVVAGTSAYVTNKGSDFMVAKLDGRDGLRRWRRRINSRHRELGRGFERAMGVGVDAAGDVIVAGELDRGHDQSGVLKSDILVMKLKMRNGKPRWKRYPQGSGGRCRALAVDSLGESAIAGGIGAPPDAVGAGPFFVTRLDSAGDGTSPILVQ